MDDFLQKLKKVVRIVLYGPAISQSDCRKAGPYQLPLIKDDKENDFLFNRHEERYTLFSTRNLGPASVLAVA